MSVGALVLIPLGPPSPEAQLVDQLGVRLQDYLQVPCPVTAELALHPAATGGCASADAVIDQLAALRPPRGEHLPDEWSLGITAADLHGPRRVRVIGEAALGGAWAVVSTARLLPDDPFLDRELLRERLFKEALHELGHLGGLSHCTVPQCVMAPSSVTGEVDRKIAEFCPACRGRFAAFRLA